MYSKTDRLTAMIGTRLKAIVRLLRCMSNGRVDFTEDADAGKGVIN